MPEKAKVRTLAILAAWIDAADTMTPGYRTMMNAKVMSGTSRRISNRPQFTLVRYVVALFALFLVCLPAGGEAQSLRTSFGPPSSEVAFRAYRLGIIPLDGKFTRFSGWLSYDPDHTETCEVHLDIDAASLDIADPASLQPVVAGPDFLDVKKFPSLTYTGSCKGDRLDGALGMHGVTGTFPLSLTWSRHGVEAEGRLVRAAWGMTASPLLAGRTIRIRVMIPLPPTSAAARN
jgi:polyisoprenoid-binding protein YceI